MNTPEPDPINDFAAANGIDTTSAVALMSAVFNGVMSPASAASGTTPGMGAGTSSLFHVAIIDDDGIAARAVRSLLGPIRTFQRRSEQRSENHQPEDFRKALLSMHPELKRALENSLSRESQRMRTVLPFDCRRPLPRGRTGRVRLLQFVQAAKLLPDDAMPHLDFILRPRLLIEDPPVGRLLEEIRECHANLALVYGGTSGPPTSVRGRGEKQEGCSVSGVIPGGSCRMSRVLQARR